MQPARSAARDRRFYRFLVSRTFSKPVLYTMLGYTVYGIREGVYLYYLNIMVFSMTGSEFLVGLGTAGRGIMAMLAYIVVGRIRRMRGQVVMMLSAAVATPLVALGLLSWQDALYVMIVNILDAGLQSLCVGGMWRLTYRMSECFTVNGVTRNNEAIAIRNMFLNLGRISGIAAFVFIPWAGANTLYALVALNVFVPISMLFMARAERLMKEE